ncbi:MAG: DsrE family protein [Thioalkalispiraceae bacterium]|jgi:uncharacterized protein involved in oxidation of intracellular sulfur
MKLGMIIYSNDPETVWNAFRLGGFATKQSDEIKVFLLAKGVECETLDTDKFNVTGEMKTFVQAGGEILACGTCLKLRHAKGSEICPVSTMEDLYLLVNNSNKLVSF